MEIRFLFKSSSGKARVHVKRLPVVVGRSDADDIKLRIPADTVSRRHCEFFLDESGTVCIRDLRSANGTRLDGKQLEPDAAVPVSSGSTVKLGTVAFRVEYKPAGADQDHDSDTIPIESAEPPPVAVNDPTEPLPRAAGGDDVAVLEPELDPAPEPTGLSNAPPRAASPPAAAAEFAFLGDQAAAADADEDPQWPAGDESPAADDEGLDKFFKGLS